MSHSYRAIDEARALYGMMQRGKDTIEQLRELIRVPPRVERRLRAFARVHAEDEPFITRL